MVHTPKLRAFETNEGRLAKFSESMDPCFKGRNAAVLQYTQFEYVDESTRRRISNAATRNTGRFEEEWANYHDRQGRFARSGIDSEERETRFRNNCEAAD